MTTPLTVLFNDVVVLEYDRTTRLPGQQREILDQMDREMDAGIPLDGRMVLAPDARQRGQYVAMMLLHGLESVNEVLVETTCAYLGNRLPQLARILASEDGDNIHLQLQFE